MWCAPHPWLRPRWRRYLTEDEKRELRDRHRKREIESLERYRESLQNELTGVNERLAQLTTPESE